jgi:hypothetical protein
MRIGRIEPGPHAPALLLGSGLGMAAVDIYLIVRWGTRGPWYNVNEIVQMVVWLVTGYLAARMPSSRRIGMLMLALGEVLA